MKKLFSLLTLALLTMSAWAQSSVTLDFTTNDWGLPTAYTVEEDSFTAGGYTITIAGTEGAGYKFSETNQGNYLIFGKSGAYLTLPAFSNAVKKIEVVGKSGASANVKQNIFVDGEAICTETTGAVGTNIYTIPAEHQAAGTIYTLKVTSNHNSQITSIVVYFEDGGETPVDPGTGYTYSKVTSLDDLVAGQKYILVYEEGKAFMGAIAANGTNYGASVTGPTLVDGVATLQGNEGILELTLGGSTGAWTLTADGQNYVAYTGSSNTLTTGNNPDATSAQWTITEKVDTGFIMTNVGANARILQYNASNPRFACYTSKQKPAVLYVSDAEPAVVVAAPVFNPAAKDFEEESITVTITAEEGAAIKYHYDNGETWNDYAAPLTLTETTTIYAKAVKDGVESAVAHATYTKVEPTPGITTLAQANELEDNTPFTFTGENDVVVTYQNGKYTFLRDATGYGEFYQDDASTMPTLTNGQVLNNNWSATRATYKGLPEYKNATNVSASDKTNETLAAPVEISALSNEMINAYVTVKNIKKFNYTGSGKNFTVTLSDGTTLTGYNQFNISLSDLPTEDGDYTAIGVVGIFNNLQFWLISWSGEATPVAVEAPVFDPAGGSFTGTQTVTLTCATDGAQIYYALGDGEYQLYEAPFTLNATTTVKAKAVKGDAESAEVTVTYTKRAEVSNIAAANELPNKTDFVFYGPAVVVYQNGSNLWIKDNTGFGLIYGNQLPAIAEGSTLAEGWEAQHYIFRGKIHEYQYPTGVAADPDEELQTITATEYTRDQLGESNINERVMIKDLTLVEETDSINQYWKRYMYNIVDGDTLTVYKFENIEYPAIEEGKTYDVEAMVSYYGSKVQLLPIAITEHTAAGMRGDVDNSGNVDISDATALINYLLYGNSEGLNMDNANCDLTGGIDISDATTLINYLLYGSW